MQRGRPSWKGRGAFWDKLRIWWSFWVLGRWSGSGWQVSGHPRRIDCCLAGRKEAEASGEKQGGPQPLAPTPGLPLVHASAPRSCYRRRAGSSWSSTGRSTVPRRCSPCTAASAPASPASASASCHGCRPVCGGSRPGLQGGRGHGPHAVVGQGQGDISLKTGLPAPLENISAHTHAVCLNTPSHGKLIIGQGPTNLQS